MQAKLEGTRTDAISSFDEMQWVFGAGLQPYLIDLLYQLTLHETFDLAFALQYLEHASELPLLQIRY